MIKHSKIEFESQEYLEFKDLTDDIECFIKETEVKNGNVLIYSTHTTMR